MEKFKTLLPYILFGILLVIVYLYTKSQTEDSIIDKQNAYAERDSLIKDKDEIYHKYADIIHINDSLSNVIMEKDEDILQKIELIVKLNKISTEGSGEIKNVKILEPTSPNKEKNCISIGTELSFSGSNGLRSYTLAVALNDPPFHKLDETFNPFDVDIYLTRNKDGIFSVYGRVSPPFSRYISLGKMNVHLEKDEFHPKSVIGLFNITALLQINFYRSSILGGGMVKFSNKWNFGYLGNFYKEHSILLGYTF